MPKFDDYTQKTAPEDTDIALILDKTANVNKKTPFSGVWNWIVSKLTSAVISQLETTNKSIVPAINELNSKTQNIYGHPRLGNEEDLIEVIKTYPRGIHFVFTNSNTGSLPPNGDGSAMILALVINKGEDINMLCLKINALYIARISKGNIIMEWTAI